MSWPVFSRSAKKSATKYLCPRQDSNLRTRLRRPALYPLSYEGGARFTWHLSNGAAAAS
jgi:hypothetical protein